jgi:hypothetical protein
VWQRKPTVLYRTDIRCESLPLDPCNLMLHQATDRILDCRSMSVGKIAEEIHAALGSCDAATTTTFLRSSANCCLSLLDARCTRWR